LRGICTGGQVMRRRIAARQLAARKGNCARWSRKVRGRGSAGGECVQAPAAAKASLARGRLHCNLATSVGVSLLIRRLVSLAWALTIGRWSPLAWVIPGQYRRQRARARGSGWRNLVSFRTCRQFDPLLPRILRFGYIPKWAAYVLGKATSRCRETDRSTPAISPAGGAGGQGRGGILWRRVRTQLGQWLGRPVYASSGGTSGGGSGGSRRGGRVCPRRGAGRGGDYGGAA